MIIQRQSNYCFDLHNHGLAFESAVFDDDTMLVQPQEKQRQEYPPVGMPVIVQSNGYRCVAYRSDDGRWISCYDGREVENVLRFYPLHYPPV